MTGKKFSNTHQRIIDAGMKHFMTYGFDKTSLRDMCADANVTTGCFYRHFESKEALFSTLVQPLIDGYYERYHKREEEYNESVKKGNIREVTLKFIDNLCDAFIENLFKYRDQFKLAVLKSKGTKYENFKEELISNEDDHIIRTLYFLKEAGFAPKKLNHKEIHMINTAFYNGVLKVLDDDFYDEDSAQYLKTIFEFFTVGWLDIFVRMN